MEKTLSEKHNMTIIDYDCVNDLQDEILFLKQKAFFLEATTKAFDHLNFTRHQRKNLVRFIGESAFMIFNTNINYTFPDDRED